MDRVGFSHELLMSRVFNGNDVDELLAFKAAVEIDPTEADRWPVLTATWLDGARARVQFDDVLSYVGGEGELNGMQTLLAALAACGVDVIATSAALLGIKIESLAIEANGHFNVAAYLGVGGSPGPGYQSMRYELRLTAPGASDEEIAHLYQMCKEGFPGKDTLTRAVPITSEMVVET